MQEIHSNTLAAKPIIGTDLRIEIDDKVYRSIMYWVDRSSHEVSGYGTAIWDKNKKLFRITDAILLDQDNNPTSSEICPVAQGKAMNEAYQRGQTEGALKWHWHSHVNMSCFWSGDDMNIIRGLGHRGWIVATVFNKQRECRSAYCQLTEVMDNKHEVFVDEIPTKVARSNTAEEIAEWEESYTKHVTERKYVSARNDFISDRSLGFNSLWGWQRKDREIIDGQQELVDRHGFPITERPSDLKEFNSKIDKIEMDRQAQLQSNSEWGSDGWRRDPITSDFQYSPIRNESLKPDEIWQSVTEMDAEEFDELCRVDENFRFYLHNELTACKTT